MNNIPMNNQKNQVCLIWKLPMTKMKVTPGSILTGRPSAITSLCQECQSIANFRRQNSSSGSPTNEDDEFEVVDKEDEESGDDEEDFTPYTYENVEYLIAPKYDDPERVASLKQEDPPRRCI